MALWLYPNKLLLLLLQDKQGRSDDDDDDDFADLYDDGDDEDDEDFEDPAKGKAKTKRFRLAKRKAIKPTNDEMTMNPRSRSARLRCLERIL